MISQGISVVGDFSETFADFFCIFLLATVVVVDEGFHLNLSIGESTLVCDLISQRGKNKMEGNFLKHISREGGLLLSVSDP